jgi:hypothetical protein
LNANKLFVILIDRLNDFSARRRATVSLFSYFLSATPAARNGPSNARVSLGTPLPSTRPGAPSCRTRRSAPRPRAAPKRSGKASAMRADPSAAVNANERIVHDGAHTILSFCHP